jgi:hypothetical protein
MNVRAQPNAGRVRDINASHDPRRRGRVLGSLATEQDPTPVNSGIQEAPDERIAKRGHRHSGLA